MTSVPPAAVNMMFIFKIQFLHLLS